MVREEGGGGVAVGWRGVRRRSEERGGVWVERIAKGFREREKGKTAERDGTKRRSVPGRGRKRNGGKHDREFSAGRSGWRVALARISSNALGYVMPSASQSDARHRDAMTSLVRVFPPNVPRQR